MENESAAAAPPGIVQMYRNRHQGSSPNEYQKASTMKWAPRCGFGHIDSGRFGNAVEHLGPPHRGIQCLATDLHR